MSLHPSKWAGCVRMSTSAVLALLTQQIRLVNASLSRAVMPIGTMLLARSLCGDREVQRYGPVISTPISSVKAPFRAILQGYITRFNIMTNTAPSSAAAMDSIVKYLMAACMVISIREKRSPVGRKS